MRQIIDLNEFAGGALAERFNQELQKVLNNIDDRNTDPKKARSVNVVVTFKGDEKRDVVNVEVKASSKLEPAIGIATKIMLDRDGAGRVTGAELKSGVPGQTYIDENSNIADDSGKVINLKQSSN